MEIQYLKLDAYEQSNADDTNFFQSQQHSQNVMNGKTHKEP
jgi:hypothetical protein